MKLTNEEKTAIAQDLASYVQNVAGGSGNKASKKLKNISGAYISIMLNGLDNAEKWTPISDDAWRNVQNQVATNRRVGDWRIVEIDNYSEMSLLYEDASKYADVYGIVAPEGSGKTCTAANYKGPGNFYHIKANEYFNRRSFLIEIMAVMGRDSKRMNISTMMSDIIAHIRRVDHPVIVIDEADKLADPVLYFFISMYNALEDQCGIILMGTDELKRRIERGVAAGRKGFAEMYSRLGRRFIEFDRPSKKDVLWIIRENGVHEPTEMQRILNDSECDIRRVKRLIQAYRRANN